MKCPNCGAGNTEEAKFCSTCGGTLGPVYIQMPVQAQIAHRAFPKWILVPIVVLVLVVAGMVAIYSLPLSTIKITMYNQNGGDAIRVTLSIDGDLKATTDINANSNVVATITVDAGTHLVEINYDYPDYPPLSNMESPAEWAQEVYLGPLSTTNLSASLGV